MTRTLGSVACAAAIVVALLLGSQSLAGRSAPAAARDSTVTVTASDYAFKLSTKTAAVGKVTFSVKNSGKHDHSFQIAGKKTAVLKPGKSAKLAVTFSKAGSFTYTSTVAGDANKGMKGTFTAKAVGVGRRTSPPASRSSSPPAAARATR